MQNSNDRLAKSIVDIPFSGIRKFFDIAAEMGDVISLSVGEPDFQTPENVRNAAIKSLNEGKTKYTSNLGMLELRHEIAAHIKRRHGVEYNPANQIVVTVGASEGVDVSLRAIINPGDEVLVVEPCYVSYRPGIIMAGGVPVSIQTKAENQFKLQPEELAAKITPRTKAILLNYPTNPTGAIMEREDLAKLVPILLENNIIVITDEIYGDLTYGGRKHVSITEFPEMYSNTILLNGFSKAYSMTGWRLAYACGPEDIMQQFTKIHQYVIMSAPTTSQYAGIEALSNCDPDIDAMREEYDKRRKLMLSGFRSLGMDCFEPFGAFYMFPSIKKSGFSSDDFCTKLLYENKVAVVPGNAFGECGEGFIRCSYAYSLESIEIALERIEEFLKKHK